MATNLGLDDDLIEEARRVGKHRTKKDAVTSALREYVRRRRQMKILDLVGQIPFDEVGAGPEAPHPGHEKKGTEGIANNPSVPPSVLQIIRQSLLK